MPLRRMGRPGLVGTAARTAVFAGTAAAVGGRVQHHQQQKWAAKDQEQYEAQQYEQQQQQAPPPQYAEPAPAAAPAEPDYMAELEQLAAMKGRGIITDEEFEAKKKQLLGI